jgi:hypothetical protein
MVEACNSAGGLDHHFGSLDASSPHDDDFLQRFMWDADEHVSLSSHNTHGHGASAAVF